MLQLNKARTCQKYFGRCLWNKLKNDILPERWNPPSSFKINSRNLHTCLCAVNYFWFRLKIISRCKVALHVLCFLLTNEINDLDSLTQSPTFPIFKCLHCFFKNKLLKCLMLRMFILYCVKPLTYYWMPWISPGSIKYLSIYVSIYLKLNCTNKMRNMVLFL